MKASSSKVLKEYFALQGAKGGKAKSKAKLAAVRANLEKARARRWPKKARTAA